MKPTSMPTVLVVDDNPLNLTLLEGLLTTLGYGVVTLANGAEVIETIRSCRPAVVLMDIHMPTVSGFDAVRALKGNTDTRDIPVFALTAMDPKKLAENADSCLFAGVLRKPPSGRDLKALLEKVAGISADCL